MNRLARILLIAYIAVTTGNQVTFAEDNVIRKLGKDAAHAGKQIGKAGKKVGKDIGKSGKKVGKGIRDSARELFRD